MYCLQILKRNKFKCGGVSIFVNICRLFNANVKQVINVSQIFAKKMIEEKIQGAIVNVSSQVTGLFVDIKNSFFFILTLTLQLSPSYRQKWKLKIWGKDTRRNSQCLVTGHCVFSNPPLILRIAWFRWWPFSFFRLIGIYCRKLPVFFLRSQTVPPYLPIVLFSLSRSLSQIQ